LPVYILNRFMRIYTHTNTYTHICNNTTTTFQCGSCFRTVWGDPDVGSFTSTDIPTREEAESKRPKKYWRQMNIKFDGSSCYLIFLTSCNLILLILEGGRIRNLTNTMIWIGWEALWWESHTQTLGLWIHTCQEKDLQLKRN